MVCELILHIISAGVLCDIDAKDVQAQMPQPLTPEQTSKLKPDDIEEGPGSIPSHPSSLTPSQLLIQWMQRRTLPGSEWQSGIEERNLRGPRLSTSSGGDVPSEEEDAGVPLEQLVQLLEGILATELKDRGAHATDARSGPDLMNAFSNLRMRASQTLAKIEAMAADIDQTEPPVQLVSTSRVLRPEDLMSKEVRFVALVVAFRAISRMKPVWPGVGVAGDVAGTRGEAEVAAEPHMGGAACSDLRSPLSQGAKGEDSGSDVGKQQGGPAWLGRNREKVLTSVAAEESRKRQGEGKQVGG